MIYHCEKMKTNSQARKTFVTLWLLREFISLSIVYFICIQADNAAKYVLFSGRIMTENYSSQLYFSLKEDHDLSDIRELIDDHISESSRMYSHLP